MAVDYGALSDLYDKERPKYEVWTDYVGLELKAKLAALKLETIVQWRAKEIDSFVKKALRKGYADPLNEIGDKAGVRVIVHYLEDVSKVESAVVEFCKVHKRESKLDALDFAELGYLGVHLDVSLLHDVEIDGVSLSTNVKGEIQIHTKSQSAWAVVSHDILYKTAVELPPEIKRRVTRLVAFVEAFDDEVGRFTNEIASHPDFAELEIIGQLDDHLVQMTKRVPDKHLSALIVPPTMRLYDDPPDVVMRDRIDPFIDENHSEIEAIYERYENDYRANPLLHQPEAFVIFERVKNDPDNLRATWEGCAFSVDLLENMAAIWGTDI